MNRAHDAASRPPALYFVPHRPARLNLHLLPPVLILAVASSLIAYRILAPDGHREFASRVVQAPAAPAPRAPATARRAPAKPAAPKPKAAPPTVARAALDDIRREADRKRAEREEIERLKEKEERRIAEADRQRPDSRRNRGPDGMARRPPIAREEGGRCRLEAMPRDRRVFVLAPPEAPFFPPPPPMPGDPGMRGGRTFTLVDPSNGIVRYEMRWEFHADGR